MKFDIESENKKLILRKKYNKIAMGFKTKSKETSQSNICNPFKVGGLIFDSVNDYQLFKDIDRNIKQTVELVKRGRIDLEEFFNKIKIINVKESYCEAREEMDGMFQNAIDLLCFEGTRLVTEYKVGCYFFNKINIIECCDSDDL